MSYKIIIEEFDKNVSNYIEKLEKKIEDIEFYQNKSQSFIISDEFDSKSLFPYKKQQGVYLFELNLDTPKLNGTKRATRVKNFAEDWSKKKNDSFFSSSVIKKRLHLRNEYDEQWLPLYIGKNKDIYKRIIEHIDLSPEKNTYAMKLRHRINTHGLEFRVTTLEFEVTNYDFIIPHIERSLREKYNPLIGKQ
jgi:hypothetical protein